MQPTTNEMGVWLLALGAVVNIVAGLAVILSGFRSQRRQVRMEETFATVNQVREVAQTLGGRIDLVDKDVRELRDNVVLKGEEQRESIEGKVEAVRVELAQSVERVADRLVGVSAQAAGLGRETELLGQRMAQVDGKLDRLIERQGDRQGKRGGGG